jgi:hypothetical protein
MGLLIAATKKPKEIPLHLAEYFNSLPKGALPHTLLRPLGRDFLYLLLAQKLLRVQADRAEK